MIYLADWHSCVTRGKQITDIKWYFDSHGPFVWRVKEAAAARTDLLEVSEEQNMYGGKKLLFKIADRHYKPKLSDAEKKSIDHVIEVTRKLYWADFIKLVYATHPVASSERYSTLDLVAAAKDYAA
ncbi:Panacea domain-containing protein [Paracoccus sp. T5]